LIGSFGATTDFLGATICFLGVATGFLGATIFFLGDTTGFLGATIVFLGEDTEVFFNIYSIQSFFLFIFEHSKDMAIVVYFHRLYMKIFIFQHFIM
jgi:hypothetical protein